MKVVVFITIIFTASSLSSYLNYRTAPTRTHTNTHTHTHAHTHTHTRMHACTHTHAYTHTHAHAYTHTHTHTHTEACTQTYKHTVTTCPTVISLYFINGFSSTDLQTIHTQVNYRITQYSHTSVS